MATQKFNLNDPSGLTGSTVNCNSNTNPCDADRFLTFENGEISVVSAGKTLAQHCIGRKWLIEDFSISEKIIPSGGKYAIFDGEEIRVIAILVKTGQDQTEHILWRTEGYDEDGNRKGTLQSNLTPTWFPTRYFLFLDGTTERPYYFLELKNPTERDLTLQIFTAK